MPGLPTLSGCGLAELGDVDSTNAEARRRFERGERGPLWITAERQLAGRGRSGRQWVSDAGNLYATLLVELDVPLPRAGELSFVAALAISDVVAAATGASPKLKWPNDVLIDGAKVSGVLIETLSVELDRVTVAVGCGLNLLHAPANTPYGATHLAAHGGEISPRKALHLLSRALSDWLKVWQGEGGFLAIRTAWVARAGALGGRLTIDTGQRSISGIYRRLADDGALVLSLDDGHEERFHAGEVVRTSTDRE